MLGHAEAKAKAKAKAKETFNTYAKLFPDRMDHVTEKMTKARTKALRKSTGSIQPV